ncbi:MAG: sigma-54 dependent transcriptional regulator [Bacteroidia bacterium]|nr:sigma-54 dependent transcriptional regulator [Bacteroidia bacterium]
MPNKARILIVDDDRDVLDAARIFLKNHGFQIDTEERPVFLTQLVKNGNYDLILLDLNFSREAISGKEGFYWLNQILETDPSAVVVLITAYGDVDTAIKAIKKGATDFVLKPWDGEKLLATINNALNIKSSRTENFTPPPTKDSAEGDEEVIGQSEAIHRVFETINKIAATDANVLILGENGTGKELIARALHQRSHRSGQVFVNVDMGAISETLFESELFGHVKGAFTDARENRMGRFEMAQKGTLFLDEIGNLSLPLQAKLLNALQQRRIVRVGSNTPIEVDIRLVCATNLPIREKVASREFRQDLLYRINTVELHLPPLRERKEDINLLAEHFIQRYARRYHKSVYSISPAALTRMEKYHWPGNIRELQHAIERAVIMTESDILQPGDFHFGTMTESITDLFLDTYNLEEVEKLIIRKAISKHGGNISKAAKELGLTRTSLYRRIEKYGLL